MLRLRSPALRSLLLRSAPPRAWLSGVTADTADIKDVVIIGGGVVGAVLASRLARAGGLSVAVVERAAPAPVSGGTAAAGGGRALALSPASLRTLDSCGSAGAALRRGGRLAAFNRMQVWDALGPGHISFDAADVIGESAVADGGALGYIADAGDLGVALYSEMTELAASGALELCCPARVTRIVLPPAASAAQMLPAIRGGPASSPAAADTFATVELEGGRVLRAAVVVGADGAASAVRSAAGITTWGWGYDQVAVVATVCTDAPAAADGGMTGGATAWQRFLPHGPVALLPLCAGADGAARASVVWSTSADHAAALLALSASDFASALDAALHAPSERFVAAIAGAVSNSDSSGNGGGVVPAVAATGDAASSDAYVRERDGIFLGPLWVVQRAGGVLVERLVAAQAAAGAAPAWRAPPRVLAAVGARTSHPLRFESASRYVAPRVALVGDAAHAVHPLAGQGLNLGLADAESLARALLAGRDAGADVGALSTLHAYAREQQGRNAVLMAGLDALKRIFDWQAEPPAALAGGLSAVHRNALWAPVITARNAALTLLNGLPAAKRALARVAMGDSLMP